VLQVVRVRFVKDEAVFAVRNRGMAALEEIMQPARESGQLRPDVTLDDSGACSPSSPGHRRAATVRPSTPVSADTSSCSWPACALPRRTN
jgi:hypothetical protein